MKRILAFDVIRTVAIIFVIAIHSCARLNNAMVLETNQFGVMHWSVTLWHIIYIAVPLFVMLSGALLLGKDESLGVFFKKRFKRVLIPFIAWSVIWGVFLFYKENKTMAGCLPWIVISFFNNGVHGIYWFVYLILGLYLITPLLRKITLNADRNLQIYFVGILLLTYLLGHYLPNIQLTHRFVSDNLIFIFYYVSGYVIYNNIEKIKPYLKWLFLILVLVYVLGVTTTMFWGKADGLSIIVFEAVLSFTLIMALPNKNRKSVELISKMSYGIYLTHFAIISLLTFVPFLRYIHAAVYPFVSIAIVLVLDLAMLQILKKIGLGKWFM